MLRGFYKELEKDRQNSSQASSNLNRASNNTNEIRYILCTMLISI